MNNLRMRSTDIKEIKLHQWALTHLCASGAQLCPNLCKPMQCSPPGYSVHAPRQNTGVSCHILLRQPSDPGTELVSPASHTARWTLCHRAIIVFKF